MQVCDSELEADLQKALIAFLQESCLNQLDPMEQLTQQLIRTTDQPRKNKRPEAEAPSLS